MDGTLIDAARRPAQGIVVAGVGNGNMTKAALTALAKQAKKGVVCVRASRVPTAASRETSRWTTTPTGLVASEELNPAKARRAVKLALLASAISRRCNSLFAILSVERAFSAGPAHVDSLRESSSDTRTGSR
jgi:L-asparaginase